MGETICLYGKTSPDIENFLKGATPSRMFADVVLCCFGGERFLTHRLVLSAASPYLQVRSFFTCQSFCYFIKSRYITLAHSASAEIIKVFGCPSYYFSRRVLIQREETEEKKSGTTLYYIFFSFYSP